MDDFDVSNSSAALHRGAGKGQSDVRSWEKGGHDSSDPSMWRALYVDHSIALASDSKRAFLVNSSSWSRQFLFPIIRVLSYLAMGVIQLLKIVLPRKMSAHNALHRFVSWGLHTFVKPEANWLILRHFHLGTQVLNFLSDNLGVDREIQKPLLPMNVWELSRKENQIIQHDVNLYNFVIAFNDKMKEDCFDKEVIDYSAIEKASVRLEDMPKGWLNFLDIESAIEVITPVFQLLCTDDEFWRASVSLQLDESIGIYCAKLLNQPHRLYAVNNKHPLLFNNTAETGKRLMLHGISTETLCEFLLKEKSKQEALGA